MDQAQIEAMSIVYMKRLECDMERIFRGSIILINVGKHIEGRFGRMIQSSIDDSGTKRVVKEEVINAEAV